MRKIRAKQWTAVLSAAAMFQTNVVWCGAPSMPLPDLFFHAAYPVFVFHANEFDPLQQQPRVEHRIPETKAHEHNAEAARHTTQMPVHRLSEIPHQGLRDALRPHTHNQNVHLLAFAHLPHLPGLSSDQTGRLRNEVGDHARVRFFAVGQDTLMRVEGNGKTIDVTFTADGKAEVSSKAMAASGGQIVAPSASAQAPAALVTTVMARPAAPRVALINFVQSPIAYIRSMVQYAHAVLNTRLALANQAPIGSATTASAASDAKSDTPQGANQPANASGTYGEMKPSLEHHRDAANERSLSPAQVQAAERRLDGTVGNISGVQVRLRYDANAGHLVAFDMGGRRLNENNKIFATTAVDANNQKVTVAYGIHHLEIDDKGNLVVKGAMGVNAGQIFKDGKVGEEGAAGGRESASAVSHGLDVAVRPDGNIVFKGGAKGGDVSFTAAVQNGVTHMEKATFTPVTAGSYDMRVGMLGGAVFARTGAQGGWDAGGGNVFHYTNWTLTPGTEASPALAPILKHFGISSTSSALTDNNGHNVGRVSLSEAHKITQIVASPTQHGLAAINAIFLAHRAEFDVGGRNATVEVGVSGEKGRATVFLGNSVRTSADVRGVAAVASAMEVPTFHGGTREDIERTFAGLAGDSRIKGYEVNTTLELNGKTYDIRVIGSGAVANGQPAAAPLILSNSRELDSFLGVQRTTTGEAVREANPKDAEAFDNKVVTFGGQQVRLFYDRQTQQLNAYDAAGNRITANQKIFSAEMVDTSGQQVQTRFGIDHFEVDGNRQLVARGAADVVDGHVFKDGTVGEGAAGGKAGAGPASHGLNVNVDENKQITFSGHGEVSFSAVVGNGGKIDLSKATYQPVTAGSYDMSITVNGEKVATASTDPGVWDTGSGSKFSFSRWTLTAPAEKFSAPIQEALAHFNISATSASLVNKDGQTVGNVQLDDNHQVRRIVGAGTEAGQAALREIFVNHRQDFASGGVHQKVEVAVAGEKGNAQVILSQNVASAADLQHAAAAATRLESVPLVAASRPEIEKALSNAIAGDKSVGRFEMTLKVQDGGQAKEVRVIGGGLDANGHLFTPMLLSNDAALNEKLSLKNAENVRLNIAIDGKNVIVAAGADGRLRAMDDTGKPIDAAVFHATIKDAANKPVQVAYRIDSFEIASNGQLVAHATANVAQGTELNGGKIERKPSSAGTGGPAPTNGSRHLELSVGADDNIRIKATSADSKVSFTAAVGANGIDASQITYRPTGAGATDVVVKVTTREPGTENEQTRVLASVGGGEQIKGADGSTYRAAVWNVTGVTDATKGRDQLILQNLGIQNGVGSVLNADGAVVGKVSTSVDGKRAWNFEHSPAGDKAIRDLYFNQTPERRAEMHVSMSGAQSTVVLNDKADFEGAKTLVESMDLYKIEGGTTQDKIDQDFKAMVGKAHGIDSYDVVIQAPGGPVRVIGQGADKNGAIRRPEIGTNNPALRQLTERVVSSIADLGVPLRGAKLESGALRYSMDLEGRRHVVGAKDEIRFSNGGGMIGKINLEDGVAKSVTFYAAEHAGAVAVFDKSGILGDRRLVVPGGQSVTVGLHDGKIDGKGPGGLNGVKMILPGENATITFRRHADGEVLADLKGTIATSFGKIDGQTFQGRLVNGELAFVARFESNDIVFRNRRIELPDAEGRVAANAVLNNVHVDRVNLNLVTGADSAVGRSWITAKDNIYVPDAAPSSGRSGGGPAEDLGRENSSDLRVRRYQNGHLVSGRGAGGWVNVSLTPGAKPGDPLRGQVHILTSGASHIEIGEGGAVLDGKTYSAGVGINKKSNSDYRYTALRANATVTSGKGDDEVVMTIRKEGATAVFANNHLLMEGKNQKALAADLANVTFRHPGVELSFEWNGKKLTPIAKPLDEGAALGDGHLNIFGHRFKATDFQSMRGRIEDGRVVFDLKEEKTIRARAMVQLSNGNRAVRDVAFKEIAFDPASSAKGATGRVRVEDGESLRFLTPQGRRGEPAARPNSARTGSMNLDIEGTRSSVRVTGHGESSYLHASFEDSGRGDGSLRAREVIFSDHARNLRVVGSGATVMGVRIEAGLTVNTGLVGKGQFSVNGSALSYGESARVYLSKAMNVAFTQGSDLHFSNGRPQLSNSKGQIVVRTLVPAMRARGITVEGGLKYARDTYMNGKAIAHYRPPAYVYANHSGHAIWWSGMSVAGGTRFMLGGKLGVRVLSGSMSKTEAGPENGVTRHITLTSTGAHAVYLDKNGKIWTPPPVGAFPKDGTYTYRDKQGSIPGRAVTRGGDHYFIPDKPLQLASRVYATEMKFNAAGGLGKSRGFAVDDQRVHHGFHMSSQGLLFERTGSFNVLGHTVNVTGDRYRQNISMKYSGINKETVVFNNRDFFAGHTTYAPTGVGVIRAQGGDAIRVEMPAKTIVARRDSDGALVLGGDMYAVMPSRGEIHVLADHRALNSRFALTAGSVIKADGAGISVTSGFIRIERGMPGYTVGSVDNIPMAVPVSPKKDDRGQGEQEPQAPPEPMRPQGAVLYNEGPNGRITVTNGTLEVQNNDVKFMNDTVLIKNGTQDTAADHLRIVVPTDRPGVGTTTLARQSFQSAPQAFAEDIFDQFDHMDDYKSGSFGTKRDQNLEFALLDRDRNRVGTAEATAHMRMVSSGSAGTGAPGIPIENGMVYLSGGKVMFNWGPMSSRQEKFTYTDDKGITRITSEDSVYSTADRLAYTQKSGGAPVRALKETLDHRTHMVGNWNWMVDATGRPIRDLAIGDMTHVTSRDAATGAVVTTSGSFERKNAAPNEARYFDLLGHYDSILSDPNISDERKVEARQQRAQQDARIVSMVQTGHHNDTAPGNQLNMIMRDGALAMNSFHRKNDVAFGVSDFAIASTWGAFDHYFLGGRNWDAGSLPAIKEMETQNAPVDRAVTAMRQGMGYDKASGIAAQSDRPWYRSIDVFASDLLGFDRWMKADSVGKVALVVGEQTLNAMSFGAGKLVKVPAFLEGTVDAIKGMRAVTAVTRTMEAIHDFPAITRMIGFAEKVGLVAPKVAEVADVAKPGVIRTIAGRGIQVYMRAGAFDKAQVAMDAWDKAGFSAGMHSDEVWAKTRGAAWDLTLSEFGTVAPVLGRFTQAVTESKAAAGTLKALGFGEKALKGVGETEKAVGILGEAEKGAEVAAGAEKGVEVAGTAEETAQAASSAKTVGVLGRTGENVVRQYATVAGIGATVSLINDIRAGKIKSPADFAAAIASMIKGAGTATIGLATLRLSRMMEALPAFKNFIAKLGDWGKESAIQQRIADLIVGGGTDLRNMGIASAMTLTYNGLDNLSEGKSFGDHWGQSLGQGAYLGFFGARAGKALVNAPAIAEGQSLRTSIEDYNIDRAMSGLGLATTSTVMKLMEPIYSRIPGVSDFVEALRGQGLLAPESASDEKVSEEGLWAKMVSEFKSSFDFGLTYHPLFGFGTPGKTVTEVTGVDALLQKAQLGTLGQYFVSGPINMNMFALMERASVWSADKAGLIHLDRTADGKLKFDGEGFYTANDTGDGAKLSLLKLMGAASAPAAFDPQAMKYVRETLAAGQAKWIDGTPLAGLRQGARDRSFRLAERIQMLDSAGQLNDTLVIGDKDGRPLTLNLKEDQGRELAVAARATLAYDPRVQAVALGTPDGKGASIELAPAEDGKDAVVLPLDADTLRSASTLAVRALDPNKDRGELEAIATGNSAPRSAQQEAVLRLRGPAAAEVYAAYRAVGLDAGAIVEGRAGNLRMETRPTGERALAVGELPSDHALARPGSVGSIVISPAGEAVVEYRGAPRADGAVDVVRRSVDGGEKTFLEINGSASEAGQFARSQGIAGPVIDLILNAGRVGAQVTLRVARDEDGAHEVVGLVAHGSGRPVDLTERVVALSAAVKFADEWIQPAATGPPLVFNHSTTLNDALRADAGYRDAARNYLQAQIKFLSQPTNTGAERRELAQLESVHLQNGYRVAFDLETAKRGLGQVDGKGLTDGGAVRELRGALDKLYRAAAAEKGTREGLNFLVQAHSLRETAQAAMRGDAARVTDVTGRFNAAGPEASRFIAAVDRQVDHRDAANPPPESGAGSLTEAVSQLMTAHDLNLSAGTMDEGRIAALDRLLSSDSNNADRAAAIGTLFRGKESISQLNDGERVALFLALSTRHRETYDKNGILPESAIRGNEADRGGVSGKDAKQAALFVQFMLGRIAGLSAGGGKTVVFTMGFADFAARPQARNGVGELIVYSQQEAAKYLSEYQPLARAMGIVFVDGTNLVNKDAKAWEAAYNPDKDANGEAWVAGQRLFKVVVTDFHSRGFMENDARANPSGRRNTLLNNVKVQAVDEADACLLSQMSFISSDGKKVATTAQVEHGRNILNTALSVLGYDNPSSVDLKSHWRVTADDQQPGYREFLPGTITENDLDKGLWFHVEANGNVRISRPLLDAIVEKMGGASKVSEREVEQVLRAVEAVHNEKRLAFVGDDEGKIRPTLMSKEGAPQVGQIDSSTLFNVAATLLHNQRMEARGGATLSESDIRLSEAGSMATFVQVLQRPVDHRFGATGTPESMKMLSEHVIGMKVADVDPSTLKDYRISTVEIAPDVAGSAGERGVEAVRRAYGADRQSSRSSGRDLHLVVSHERLDDDARAEMQAQAILRSIGDTGVNAGQGAGIVAGGTEAVHKLSVIHTLAGALSEAGSSAEAEVVDRLLSHAASDGGVSLRDFVNAVQSDAFASRLADLPDPARKLVLKIAGKFKVFDGTGDDVQEVVATTASEGHIVLTNEQGLRALSYDAKSNLGQQVDLFLSGFEGFTKEGWLQALARVDRRTEGARRTVVLEMPVLDAHLNQAVAVDRQMKADGRSHGIFAPDEMSAVAPGESLAFHLDHHEALNTSEKLELVSEFLSRDNRARSALFFIGEQSSVQLLKQPIQEMVARERESGNEEGARYLEGVYRAILGHSDKGAVSDGASLQDFRRIAADSFNNAAQTAAQFHLLVASEGEAHGVSAAVVQEARLRAADVIGAMEHVGEALNNPLSEDQSFVEVSNSILGESSEPGSGRPARSPARHVLDVVSQLASKFLLSNTALAPADPAVLTRSTYVARASRSDLAGDDREGARRIAEALPAANEPTGPRPAAPTVAERRASSSVALLEFGRRGTSVVPPLTALGYRRDDQRASSEHEAQSDFLARFEDPRAAFALGTVLNGLGVHITADEAARLLNAASPSRALAHWLGETLSGQPGLVMRQAGEALAAQDEKTGFARFANVRVKNGEIVGKRTAIVPAISAWMTNKKDPVAALSEMPLSDIAVGDESHAPALAAALYLILQPEKPASAVTLARRLKDHPDVLSTVPGNLSDLDRLADPSSTDDAAIARFQVSATEPTKISDSAWYKPALAVATGLALIGATAAAITGLAPAIPGLAPLAQMGTVVASKLAAGGTGLVAGAFVAPLVQLVTGQSPADFKPGAAASTESSSGPNWMGVGAAALTMIGTLAVGRALTVALGGAAPGGLVMSIIGASTIALLAGKTTLGDQSSRSKAAFSLLMAGGAAALFSLPGMETTLNAVAAPFGNIVAGSLDKAIAALAAGGVAFGTLWAVLNGPAQAVVNRRSNEEADTRASAERTVRLDEKASKVLSRLLNDAGDDGAVTVGDLWKAIKEDASIDEGDKLDVFRHALLQYGMSEDRADALVERKKSGADESDPLDALTLDDISRDDVSVEDLVDLKTFENSWGFDGNWFDDNSGETPVEIPASLVSAAENFYFGHALPEAERSAFVAAWSDVLSFGRSLTAGDQKSALPAMTFRDIVGAMSSGRLSWAYAAALSAAPGATPADGARAQTIARAQEQVLGAVAQILMDGKIANGPIASFLTAVQSSPAWTPALHERLIQATGEGNPVASDVEQLLTRQYFNPVYLGLIAASGEAPASPQTMPALARVWNARAGLPAPLSTWAAAAPVYRSVAMVNPGVPISARLSGTATEPVIDLVWPSEDGAPQQARAFSQDGSAVVAIAPAGAPELPPAYFIVTFAPVTRGPAVPLSATLVAAPEAWHVEVPTDSGAWAPLDNSEVTLPLGPSLPGLRLAPLVPAGARPTYTAISNPVFNLSEPASDDEQPTPPQPTAPTAPQAPSLHETETSVAVTPPTSASAPGPSDAQAPVARIGNTPEVPRSEPAVPSAMTIEPLRQAVARVIDAAPEARANSRDGAPAPLSPASLLENARVLVTASQEQPATAETAQLAIRPASEGRPEAVYLRLPAGWVELTPMAPRWVVTPPENETHFYLPLPALQVHTGEAGPDTRAGRGGVAGFLSRVFNLPSLLIIGSLGLLSVPAMAHAAPAAATALAPSDGLSPAAVILSLVGVRAAVVLTADAYTALRSNKAADQRAEAATTAPHPFVVPVPTADGRRAIRFASQQPFERAFFATPGDTEERIFVRTADTNAAGETIIGEGRELHALTVVGAPSHPTPALRDLATALAEARVPSSNASGKVAAKAMESVLNQPVVGGWARQIALAPLLARAEVPEELEPAVSSLGDHPTLGQVEKLAGMQDLKAFIYELVLQNAEALVTPAGTMISGDTLARLRTELGLPLVLQHTHPGSSVASLADRVTAHGIYVWGVERGIVAPLPFLISNDHELTFHDDAKDTLLTMSAKKEILEIHPVTAPYQSLRIGPAIGTELDRPNLWRRLRTWLSSGHQKSPLGLFPAEMSGGNGQVMERAGLELAYAIHEMDLSPAQIRKVWNLVADNVFTPASETDIEKRLGDDRLAGLGLAALIHQLSAQIRETRGAGHAGAINMAATGHLPEVGIAVQQYLNVAALPASLDGPEAEWVMREIARTLDLNLLSPENVNARAAEIRSRLKAGGPDPLVATLLSMAGLREADFMRRLEAASTGGFTTRADVESVLSGRDGDEAARDAAISLLVQPVARALATASGLAIDSETQAILNGLQVEIVAPDARDLRVTHRSAALIPPTGNEPYRVQIILEPGLTGEEALSTAVGRLTHELAHVLARHEMAGLQIDGLGVPTLAEEAWVGMAVSRGLHWMGLHRLADTVDLETLGAVADMQGSRAFYVVYDELRGDQAAIDALTEQVRATRGNTRVVVLAPARQIVAARHELEHLGLHVVSTERLKNIVPSGRESRLEAHARLFLGTSQVRLVLRRSSAGGPAIELGRYPDVREILLRAGGQPALDLVEEIAADRMAEGLRTLLQRHIAAARQA